jgi:nitrogen-specific signal transduction histidine kinase
MPNGSMCERDLPRAPTTSCYSGRFESSRPNGIPADVLERIFTPFFTTKARGSGLGLSTVRRLIEPHHGTIGIACPSAGGTVVTVQLPGERLTVVM